MSRLIWLFLSFIAFGCSTTPETRSTQEEFVPLNQVALQQQFKVTQKNQSFLLTRKSQQIILHPNNPFISINGKPSQIPSEPQLRGKELWVSKSFGQLLAQLPAPKELPPPAPAKEMENSLRPIPQIPSLPLSPKKKGKILLDPGHGGKDPGAVSKTGGLSEKDLNLKIAQKTAERLESEGFDVILTRDKDVFLSLDERVSATAGSDLFISIHANAASGEAHGYEIIYQSTEHHDPSLKKDSERLARSLLGALEKNLPQARNRGLKQNQRELRVLKKPEIPSVLVEMGFISNRQEESNLNNHSYQEALAEGIAQGIASFLGS